MGNKFEDCRSAKRLKGKKKKLKGSMFEKPFTFVFSTGVCLFGAPMQHYYV